MAFYIVVKVAKDLMLNHKISGRDDVIFFLSPCQVLAARPLIEETKSPVKLGMRF